MSVQECGGGNGFNPLAFVIGGVLLVLSLGVCTAFVADRRRSNSESTRAGATPGEPSIPSAQRRLIKAFTPDARGVVASSRSVLLGWLAFALVPLIPEKLRRSPSAGALAGPDGSPWSSSKPENQARDSSLSNAHRVIDSDRLPQLTQWSPCNDRFEAAEVPDVSARFANGAVRVADAGACHAQRGAPAYRRASFGSACRRGAAFCCSTAAPQLRAAAIAGWAAEAALWLLVSDALPPSPAVRLAAVLAAAVSRAAAVSVALTVAWYWTRIGRTAARLRHIVHRARLREAGLAGPSHAWTSGSTSGGLAAPLDATAGPHATTLYRILVVVLVAWTAPQAYGIVRAARSTLACWSPFTVLEGHGPGVWAMAGTSVLSALSGRAILAAIDKARRNVNEAAVEAEGQDGDGGSSVYSMRRTPSTRLSVGGGSVSGAPRGFISADAADSVGARIPRQALRSSPPSLPLSPVGVWASLPAQADSRSGVSSIGQAGEAAAALEPAAGGSVRSERSRAVFSSGRGAPQFSGQAPVVLVRHPAGSRRRRRRAGTGRAMELRRVAESLLSSKAAVMASVGGVCAVFLLSALVDAASIVLSGRAPDAFVWFKGLFTAGSLLRVIILVRVTRNVVSERLWHGLTAAVCRCSGPSKTRPADVFPDEQCAVAAAPSSRDDSAAS